MRLEETLLHWCPAPLQLPFKYHYAKWRGRLEPELLYLKQLVAQYGRQGRRAIDVGANQGLYTYQLSQLFEIIEVFEPQPWCTGAIVAYRDSQKQLGSAIQIHHVGLSDHDGSLSLYVPKSEGDYATEVAGLGRVSTGLASFQKSSEDDVCWKTPVKRLDDYQFTDVALVKIDVEGHEQAVLKGAIQTIQREHPLILIEIEQRHLLHASIQDIFTQIANLGYAGYFLRSQQLIALKNFSYEQHQAPFINNILHPDYIHNFIFIGI